VKYMLLMTYHVEGVPPVDTWAPEDVKRMIQFQHDLDASLVASGELVGAEGLAWPDQAKLVRSDGVQPPVITDGPFAESKEFLIGFWIVDVDSPERAYEIAARASAQPGPGGAPLGIPIEVRPVGVAPSFD
jgi:hypothetical protein